MFLVLIHQWRVQMILQNRAQSQAKIAVPKADESTVRWFFFMFVDFDMKKKHAKQKHHEAICEFNDLMMWKRSKMLE